MSVFKINDLVTKYVLKNYYLLKTIIFLTKCRLKCALAKCGDQLALHTYSWRATLVINVAKRYRLEFENKMHIYNDIVIW